VLTVKLDFHVHSNTSPDALHSLKHLAVRAKAIGLDGIAVCDHDAMPTDNFMLEGLLIMRGMECSAQEGHIAVFGVPSDFDVAPGMPAAEIASRAKRAGGISIVTHAFSIRKMRGSMGSHAFNVRATAIERFNGSDFVHNMIALPRVPVGTGGSDAHSVYELANAYTVLECEPREDAVLEAVRKKQMRAVLSQNPLSILRGRYERLMRRDR